MTNVISYTTVFDENTTRYSSVCNLLSSCRCFESTFDNAVYQEMLAALEGFAH